MSSPPGKHFRLLPPIFIVVVIIVAVVGVVVHSHSGPRKRLRAHCKFACRLQHPCALSGGMSPSFLTMFFIASCSSTVANGAVNCEATDDKTALCIKYNGGWSNHCMWEALNVIPCHEEVTVECDSGSAAAVAEYKTCQGADRPEKYRCEESRP